MFAASYQRPLTQSGAIIHYHAFVPYLADSLLASLCRWYLFFGGTDREVIVRLRTLLLYCTRAGVFLLCFETHMRSNSFGGSAVAPSTQLH